ncbi:MAG TPA: DUF4124 domain-containing protein, partial [Rhodocyclaceae bacterium]|nr:DUF4124 domain-containing protein [Rhodocyclaceae bacterium]
MLSATASCWAADDVFKWVDSSGHVYYGDDPPEGIHATRVEGGVSVVSDMGGRIKPSASPGASSSTTNPAS